MCVYKGTRGALEERRAGTLPVCVRRALQGVRAGDGGRAGRGEGRGSILPQMQSREPPSLFFDLFDFSELGMGLGEGA